MEYYKMLVFGDRHAVNNDNRIDRILLNIMADCGPDLKFIIDLGDGLDADCLSTYDKDHSQLVGLQKELNSDYTFRSMINEVSPGSEKILLECNHFSARLKKAMTREYWMEDLDALKQNNLMQLDQLGWKLMSEFIWGRNKILFMHGDGDLGIGSTKNPINKARDLMKENNITIVRGHSHTTGMEVHRKFGEYYYAIQIGTMYNLAESPKYIKSGQYLSNWTNSAGIFTCSMDGKWFDYKPIIINEGRAVCGGKIYE